MGEKYKLTYFNIQGRAEPIRMLLAVAGVEYEDYRIDFPHGIWPQLKPTTKWGHVPLLEINGDVFGEINAIQQYLSRKYGFNGKTLMEELRVDEIVSASQETLRVRTIFWEPDAVKKAEAKNKYINELLKPFLTKITKLKKENSGKWLVGQNLTLADIYVGIGLECLERVDATVIDEFPVMKQFYADFNSVAQVKTWIETRPKTSW